MTATMSKAAADYRRAVAQQRRAEENFARYSKFQPERPTKGPRRTALRKMKAYERALRELRQARRARRRAVRHLLYRQGH